MTGLSLFRLRVSDPRTELLAAKADPITGASATAGRLVVHVNANDLAASGARPTWMLLTALYPPGTAPAAVAAVGAQVDAACRELGVALVGGHTELTEAVTQPVLCGTMLGPLLTRTPVRTGGARPGDRIVLTKGAALEAMAILCDERAEHLAASGVFESVEQAKAFAEHCSGQISVVPESRVALLDAQLPEGAISSMHDPTEGGIAGAVHEMADASGRGFRLYVDRIPVAPETQRVADHYQVDVMELISSGALLLCCDAVHVDGLLGAFEKAGIVAADVGEILDDPQERHGVWGDAPEKPLTRPEQDALWSCSDDKK